MPILNFNDVKGNFQSYDFQNIVICRLAGFYIAMREAVTTDIADESIATINSYSSSFDVLHTYLNELNDTISHATRVNLYKKEFKIRFYIAVEDILQRIYNTLLELSRKINDKLALVIGDLNSHLISNIASDWDMVLQNLLQQKNLILTIQVNSENWVEKLQNAIRTKQMNDLLQLRDFLNIYLCDVTQKPSVTIVTTVGDTLRDLTRTGAALFGMALGGAGALFGANDVTDPAADWLKSWNDKHCPPKFTSVPRLV
jgi:hypothetical protein